MLPIEFPLEKALLVSKLTNCTTRSRSARAFRELLGRPSVVLNMQAQSAFAPATPTGTQVSVVVFPVQG
jgi:hypothetical protein